MRRMSGWATGIGVAAFFAGVIFVGLARGIAAQKAAGKRDNPTAGAPRAMTARAEAPVQRRDPFEPLINVQKPGGGPLHLPPGKAGLMISSLRLEGTVKAPSGMIAVVSNPDQRVYFIREGDRLYDGEVVKINMDGVEFKQIAKDAFGKTVEREVMRPLYPSAGEQQ